MYRRGISPQSAAAPAPENPELIGSSLGREIHPKTQ
jgi:hypothetical protein